MAFFLPVDACVIFVSLASRKHCERNLIVWVWICSSMQKDLHLCVQETVIGMHSWRARAMIWVNKIRVVYVSEHRGCGKFWRCGKHGRHTRVYVMQGGAGAKPDPCVFYLHLNEARGDLPFLCRQPLPWPVKQTLISFSGKVTHRVVQPLPESRLSLSFVPGKGLDPKQGCHVQAICTWASAM